MGPENSDTTVLLRNGTRNYTAALKFAVDLCVAIHYRWGGTAGCTSAMRRTRSGAGDACWRRSTNQPARSWRWTEERAVEGAAATDRTVLRSTLMDEAVPSQRLRRHATNSERESGCANRHTRGQEATHAVSRGAARSAK